MNTKQLLRQSQALAEELQRTNAALACKNRDIERKADQLALASRYKSEFLANVSHELRTPLSNLLILSRLLAENPESNLTPKQVKFAETIHTSGTDLLALINDILDLSKIESGKMEADIGEMRFGELEEYCLTTFRHIAEGKGLDFAIQRGADLPEAIETDAKRLRQVVKNLLSNALKFTERGFVKLTVERASVGWTPGHPTLSRAEAVIGFAVSDTGIGISPDQQQQIFEAFQQGDGSTGRTYGGTGLGLSISRELAVLLGGEICLQSSPGAGSTFTLYLPQNYAAPAPGLKTEFRRHQHRPAPERVRETGADFRGRTVLIVDHDVRSIFALTSLLEDCNLTVLHAENGSNAIELLKKTPQIALVLLDLMISEMDGFQIIKAIRQLPQFPTIPLIALTAFSTDIDKVKCLEAGASACLAKPVDLDQLFSNLHTWIGNQRDFSTIAAGASQ